MFVLFCFFSFSLCDFHSLLCVSLFPFLFDPDLMQSTTLSSLWKCTEFQIICFFFNSSLPSHGISQIPNHTVCTEFALYVLFFRVFTLIVFRFVFSCVYAIFVCVFDWLEIHLYWARTVLCISLVDIETRDLELNAILSLNVSWVAFLDFFFFESVRQRHFAANCVAFTSYISKRKNQFYVPLSISVTRIVRNVHLIYLTFDKTILAICNTIMSFCHSVILLLN